MWKRQWANFHQQFRSPSLRYLVVLKQSHDAIIFLRRKRKLAQARMKRPFGTLRISEDAIMQASADLLRSMCLLRSSAEPNRLKGKGILQVVIEEETGEKLTRPSARTFTRSPEIVDVLSVNV